MRPGIFRFARILAITLPCAIVAAIAALTSWRMSLASKNRARLKAISERGEPVDSAALNQSYAHVPDGENAAFVWLEGVAQMTPEAESWTKFKIPSRGTNLSEAQVAWARDIVQSNEEALKTFRKAATLTKARYPIDLTPGVNALLPHLGNLKQIARLLQAEVVVAVADNDTQRAVDAIRTILGIG